LTLTALAVVSALAVAPTPASAQFMDKLGKGAKLAQKANDLVFTEAEEVELGQKVSAEIRQRFGVVQDPAVHRYVTLVGAVLVTNSTRPNLPWTFIVLDTDAVNAFAAPGGFVHITRGALALMSNEAELAGVLGHELIHITEKHTIAYLKKSAATSLAVDASGKGDSKISSVVVGQMKEVVLKGFGRKEEMESDEKGLALANKAGYAPGGLGGFLQKIADRNKSSTEKRGLFASHPEMNERIKKLGEMAAKMNATATLDARFKKFISYPPPKAIADIAVVTEGSAGLAGGGGSNGGGKKAESTDAKKEEPKKAEAEQPKKKGFGLSRLSNIGGGDQKQAQVTGSGGGRGLDPEVDAKGGGNPTLVAVKVTASDVEAFKKEGKLS
jgi:Zn-dependent protease with chaperone function